MSTALEIHLRHEQSLAAIEQVRRTQDDWLEPLRRNLLQLVDTPETRLAVFIEARVILASAAITEQAGTVRRQWHATWNRQDSLRGLARIRMERGHLLPDA